MNELRENWLNSPEWTTTRILEFPGSIDGLWSRYINGGMTSVSSQNQGRDSARPSIGIVRYPRIEPRDEDCAKKLAKRTLTNLYNERPAWLVHAHKKLDAAVAAAYGWSDLIEILERGETGEIYDFKTASYGIIDCDPKDFAAILKRLEQDVNEQILERLLALNQHRAAEEKSASRKSRRTSRAKTEDEFV